MTTKHTPGPWMIDEVVDEPYRAEKYWVAHLNLGPQRTEAPWPNATATVAPCLGLRGQPVSRETIEANAHLIAAAPDLLDALEAAHGYLVMMGTEHANHIRSVCLAAILKAQGKKP